MWGYGFSSASSLNSSGHSSYTKWICCDAGYLLYEGLPVKIIGGFFTSDPYGAPNSDVFNIKLENGRCVQSDDGVDWDDLYKRYEKQKYAMKLKELKIIRMVNLPTILF